jgi:hypothetical protein
VVDPRWNLSPRGAFQMVGTDWIRQRFHEHFWVERMRFELMGCLDTNTRIVISDVRFENEKDLVLELGGVVWGISRRSTRYHKEDRHESETNMDSFFASLPYIENDGGVDDLYTKTDTYLNTIVLNS